MLKITTRTTLLLASATLFGACGRDRPNDNRASAAGALDTSAVDTATIRTSGATPATGPGIHVTRTDGKSVTRAMRYELTPDNFSHFVAAADSVVAVAARDSNAHAALLSNLTDAGSTDADAGRKWLESIGPVSVAVNQAGISIKDYFVAGIAIAAAERFMADPKAAPPTPSLEKNAQFLRSHSAELERLHTQESFRPVVVSKP
jgi:hypothetical protein